MCMVLSDKMIKILLYKAHRNMGTIRSRFFCSGICCSLLGLQAKFLFSFSKLKYLDFSKYNAHIDLASLYSLFPFCDSSHISLVVNYPSHYSDPHFSLCSGSLKKLDTAPLQFQFSVLYLSLVDLSPLYTTNPKSVEHKIVEIRSKISTNVWERHT